MSSLNVDTNNLNAVDNSNPETENAEIFQLLYISVAIQEFNEKQLTELLSKARENNESLGISGMLLFHDGSFIQALEGDEQTVDSLYNKIATDERHAETRVLFRGVIEERDFDGWSMGFYRSNQSAEENLEGFNDFMQRGFRSSDKDGGSSARQAMRAFRDGNW